MCRWIGLPAGSPFTKTRPGSGESGFTLLEVLVAFAVLAVMIVPILQVFGGGLGAVDSARARSTAALLARSKLAEVGAGETLMEGETSGIFNVPGFRWRRTIVRDTSELISPEQDAGFGRRQGGTTPFWRFETGEVPSPCIWTIDQRRWSYQQRASCARPQLFVPAELFAGGVDGDVGNVQLKMLCVQ